MPERSVVHLAAVQHFGPGEQLLDPLPGDFILTHGGEFSSKLIRLGQGLRFWGPDRQYTHWNHTALIVDANGCLVEALYRGVAKRHISVYDPTAYHCVRIEASPEDRQQMVAFAEHWRRAEARYAWWTISGIVLSLLTGARFSFGIDGQFICSGLVTQALERAGEIFDRDSSNMTPADLAKRYRIAPPPSGSPKGTPPPPYRPVPSGSEPPCTSD